MGLALRIAISLAAAAGLTALYLGPLGPNPTTVALSYVVLVLLVATEWGLVEAPGSTFMGVYSLSPETPIKQNNFRDADKAFEGKSKYSEWKFVYIPAKPAAPVVPATPGKTATPASPVTTPDVPAVPVTPAIPVLSEPPSS